MSGGRGRSALGLGAVARYLLPAVCLLGAYPAYAGSDPETLLRNMKPAWKRVSDLTMEIAQRELIGTKTVERTIFVKFQKPFRVYIKYTKGDAKGREVIYQGSGWNGGKVLATLGSFPNLTFSINPFAKRAIENKHHPITNVGFDFLIKTAFAQLETSKANGELNIAEIGGEVIDGRACTRVEMKLNPKRGKEVSPKKGDTWMSLAKEHGSNYSVIAHNNQGEDPGDPASKIWVPAYYGSKMETCIDDATGLPIKVTVWDAAGALYEEYSFLALKVNVGLGDLDFDPKNSDYDF
jgi:outer membrane lipoprotein-sorting protein